METPVLVATGDGLFRVEEGKAASLGFAGRAVQALAGADADLWAIVDAAEVWRRQEDRWDHQTTVAEGLRANCLLLQADRLLIGTSEAHLLVWDGAALVRDAAFDEVEGRREWHTPWGGPPDVRSLAHLPDGTVLANVHVGGIVRGGTASWAPTLDIRADVHQVIAPAPPGSSNLALAATAWGPAVSRDGGRSWEFDTAGLPTTYQRSVALAAGFLLAGIADGSGGGHVALYRKELRSKDPFAKCEPGLPDWFPGHIDTFALVARDETVVAADPEGSLYGSDDAGATWSLLAAGLPRPRALLLV